MSYVVFNDIHNLVDVFSRELKETYLSDSPEDQQVAIDGLISKPELCNNILSGQKEILDRILQVTSILVECADIIADFQGKLLEGRGQSTIPRKEDMN
jgi:hypothetical protein